MDYPSDTVTAMGRYDRVYLDTVPGTDIGLVVLHYVDMGVSKALFLNLDIEYGRAPVVWLLLEGSEVE